MIVLGIETSTARSSVALLVDGELVAHEAHEDARGHGAFVAPAVRRCLDATSGAPMAVAVGVGPGLYTGLRVGMAIAATFAAARGLPAIGISGMDALASGCGAVGTTIVTTLDARRGQVFWAVHRSGDEDPTPQRVEGPRVGTRAELDDVLSRLAGAGTLHVIGEVAAATVTRPDAADTARLALLARERHPDARFRPEDLVPDYLRDADVRIGWAERGGRGGGDSVPS